jgi:HSP20 family protein
MATKELVKGEKALMKSSFEDFERWFEDMWARPASLLASSFWPTSRLAHLKELSPSIDMFVDGKELVIKADLPGVKKEDISIDISENMLTISGEKKKEEKVETHNYYRFERSHGSFFRRFELPEGSNTEKVKAHYDNGVLELRIPLAEGVIGNTKKIPIT